LHQLQQQAKPALKLQQLLPYLTGKVINIKSKRNYRQLCYYLCSQNKLHRV